MNFSSTRIGSKNKNKVIDEQDCSFKFRICSDIYEVKTHIISDCSQLTYMQKCRQ